jgi:hypothetical protein
VDAATGETSLLVVSPSCGLRFFPGALTDLVAEIRNLIGDVGSSFLAAGRRDEQTDTYSDAHSDYQSTNFAEHVGIFFATKSVGRSTDTMGRGVIRIPDPVLDVIDIVRQALSKGINQVKSGTEQYTKKWFSLSESHSCVSRQ